MTCCSRISSSQIGLVDATAYETPVSLPYVVLGLAVCHLVGAVLWHLVPGKYVLLSVRPLLVASAASIHVRSNSVCLAVTRVALRLPAM